MQDRVGSTLDATDPDISRFVARGGKLILWHGWNDAVVSPAYSVAYHGSVVRALGLQAVARSVRLFMAPGVEHGIGGPGPDRFGQFSSGDGDPERSLGAAMRRWVEQDVAPEQVIAVRYRSPNDPASGVARAVRVTQGGGVPGRRQHGRRAESPLRAAGVCEALGKALGR